MRHRRVGFHLPSVALLGTLAAGGSVQVVDFEQAPAGADAFELYQARGVTLSTHPSIFETLKARSGRHALRNVSPGQEAPSRWVSIEFAPEIDVRRVEFFVGLAETAPGEPVRIVVDGMTPVAISPETPHIRLPASFDRQEHSLAGGPQGRAAEIATRVELSRKPDESPISVVRITPVPGPSAILVDDLTFEARSPRPRSLPSPAAPTGTRPAGPASMAGGCDAFTWDMSREMALWDEPGLSFTSSVDGSITGVPAPVGRRLDVKLHPLANTRFLAPPERAPAGGWAGLLPVVVPADGLYRISAGGPVWIDVVDGLRPVASAKFEGHAGCAKVHKVVAFPLKAGRRYNVQLSGSEKPEVSIMVTADR
jgi:hypothetical protein